MKMCVKGFSNPWDYYLAKSQELCGRYKNPRVLKADSCNEASNQPIKGGIAGNLNGEIVCIEINPSSVQRARENCPEVEIMLGDIAGIPFINDNFDVILDLSTIDHIRFDQLDYQLREYRRVLHEKGRLLLISWVTDNLKYKEEQAKIPLTNHDYQYFHNHNDMARVINNIFYVEKGERILEESDIYLMAYWLFKRA